ncbi:MAG TPA: hypothetical protein VFD16_02395 [Candidatus Saccharimonadales bacterium]|nr:hypothetical protein [Candidatus Saccharimonadales bacterium]
MRNKKESTTNWFVEPEDANTNEIIARNLRAINQVEESVALKDANDNDRAVYQVNNYSFITQLYKDSGKFQLHFKVFYRSGKNGSLRLWELGEKKKSLNIQKIKRSIKKL